MGLRDLFKVRKPGNGNSVQKGFEKAGKKGVNITNKGQRPISEGKKPV